MDWKFDTPATESVIVDEQTSAAIKRGLNDAETGRTVSLDEAREKVTQWITRFESQRKP